MFGVSNVVQEWIRSYLTIATNKSPAYDSQ